MFHSRESQVALQWILVGLDTRFIIREVLACCTTPDLYLESFAIEERRQTCGFTSPSEWRIPYTCTTLRVCNTISW